MGGSDCIKHLECASRVEFAIFSIIKSFNRILSGYSNLTEATYGNKF